MRFKAARDTALMMLGLIVFFVVAGLYPAVVVGACMVVLVSLGIYCLYRSFLSDYERRAVEEKPFHDHLAQMREESAYFQKRIEDIKVKLKELEDEYSA